MTTVRSWDVFDTLIARTVPHPTDIFSIVESSHPYPSFKANRMEAERRSNGTLSDIYKQFQTLTGASAECVAALQSREFQTELENTIPVLTNVNRLHEGDILVSDMYLTESHIRTLLAHHGITRFRRLYVSTGGKHNGSAWDTLSKEYTILSHTGDNMHSDVAMPARYGIRGIYTDAYKFTPLETALFTMNRPLARILRTFRLSNPYHEISTEYKLFNDQINYNIPLLLVICRTIADTLTKENRTTVLFLTRDGCLLIKLFKVLYPEFKAIYFHSSRKINEHYNEDYVAYVRSVYDKDSCLLFDLNGAFKTARPFYQMHFNHLPRVLLFSYDPTAPLYEGLSFMVRSVSDAIEKLNADTVGTLINFVGTRDIRAPLDYDGRLVHIHHKTVDSFCSYAVRCGETSILTHTESFRNLAFWEQYYKTYFSKNNFTLQPIVTK
jgi:hypothetical protein